MLKKAFSVIFATMIVFTSVVLCFAHDRTGHDADIEYVLFGDENYKYTHPSEKSIIQALEDATFLCVDQFNGSGKNELRNLRDNEKIPGIIKSIDEINYTSNYAHRGLTHRGWNMSYDEKAHWPLRQTLLIKTVQKELFSSETSILSKLPWAKKKYSDKKIESFCVLLYYIHILGDHLEAGENSGNSSGAPDKTLAQKQNGIALLAPLVSPNDKTNPGVIPDLIKYLGILFEEQKETSKRTYGGLIQELQMLEDQCRVLVGSTGGINTEEKFDEYYNCAKKLREVLGTYIPMLLKKEAFFTDTFYSR